MRGKTNRQNARKQPVNYYLLGTLLTMVLFGLIAVFSASTVLSFERFGHNNYYFFRHGIFAAAGLILIFIGSRIDYHFWRRWAWFFLLISIFGLTLVLIPGVGFQVGSASRWINTGFFLIQPSEFAKLAVILYLAAWFSRKPGAETNFWFGIIPPLFMVLAVIGLVAVEPDVGTAFVIGLLALLVLFAAGTSLKYLIGLFISAVLALWFLIQISPYRLDRITSFLNPSSDPQGIGYHITQALIAVGSGGAWGQGYGLGIQKHNYLPEVIGDSIFAVLAEELGFFRILILVLGYLLIGFIGFKIAASAPDRFGQLAAVGITGWIFFQAILNIAAITKILPLTGIVLPFISYGGSSLLSLCLGAGILLNISRHRV